jgi:hypothetical protein
MESEEGSTMDSTEAAAALSAMQDSRARLAAAANCPPERHLVFAGLLGGLVAAQAATPFVTMALEALIALGVGLVFVWDRKRTGMFINGYRAGRTRPMTFSLLAMALSLGALGVWLKMSYGIVWAPVLCGVVVGVAAYFMSAAWQNIYRRELRDMP